MNNLSRILGPLFYHSPEQLMQFYDIHTRSKMQFFSVLWKKGVMEIFCKLMEAECGKQFFREYKSNFLNIYYSLLK